MDSGAKTTAKQVVAVEKVFKKSTDGLILTVAII